jgi:hypothetical protein
MNRLQPVCDNFCNFEPAGIRTDIDGGKGGHKGVDQAPENRKSSSAVKIHDHPGSDGESGLFHFGVRTIGL